MPRQRTPQEKKKLSLTKDRRNVYGESTRGTRKNIPLNKRLRNRLNRRRQEAPLPTIPLQLDTDAADAIESAVLSKKPKHWNKSPDAPLAEVIARKQDRRKTPPIRAKAQKVATVS